MPFRPSREPRGPDRFLDYKIVLFVLGAALAMVGIALGRNWLVYVGLIPLAAGIVLRLIGERRGREMNDT
jgi:cadmium resistance protein CadD (predicted permease)